MRSIALQIQIVLGVTSVCPLGEMAPTVDLAAMVPWQPAVFAGLKVWAKKLSSLLVNHPVHSKQLAKRRASMRWQFAETKTSIFCLGVFLISEKGRSPGIFAIRRFRSAAS